MSLQGKCERCPQIQYATTLFECFWVFEVFSTFKLRRQSVIAENNHVEKDLATIERKNGHCPVEPGEKITGKTCLGIKNCYVNVL